MALQSTIRGPYPTLPISQANWLAPDCFSDISRAAGLPLTLDTLRHCAQGPHANRRHVRGGDAGMKRHRPMARPLLYTWSGATGSLADLHLRLHAGPLPVGRWPAAPIWPSVRCDGRVAVLAEGLSNDQSLLSYARRALYLKPLAAPGTRRARQRQCCDIICAVTGVLWECAAR